MKELEAIQILANSFSKLPGVGAKTAERIAYSVLEMTEDDAFEFALAIQNAKTKIHKCPICGLYAEGDVCDVCGDPTRDHSTCVVVSYPKEASSFEKVAEFNGVFHVLGGVISPSKGLGIDKLNVEGLADRIEKEGIREVVIATSNTIEGETTALFLKNYLEGKNVSVTKLATGIPMGASLEYADSLTLKQALQGRKKI